MRFRAKYDIELTRRKVIKKDTIVDIVKLWHNERTGTRYELSNGVTVPAEIFNQGFEEAVYETRKTSIPRQTPNPTSTYKRP